MHVSGLWLQNFRNFTDKQWQFSSGLNIFSAPNGSGKSNLIEALALLSHGASWRAKQTDELIEWGQELARVQAKVVLPDTELKLEQMYTHGKLQGKTTNKRLYRVNGVSRRAQDAVGQLFSVLFTPEDMEMFQIGPSARRRQLDQLLDQVFPQYRYARRQYEQALKRRNRLLQNLKEGKASRTDFFMWDRLLVEHGETIHTHRSQFLHWLNDQPGVREEYKIIYDHSVISEARLKQYEHAEVGTGYTLVGPHKDDVMIEVQRGGEWRNIERFGSRGEQRLALVWWKLSEVEFIQRERSETPVLLLDDVFSELDTMNQGLIELAAQKAQAIITTVESEYPSLLAEG